MEYVKKYFPQPSTVPEKRRGTSLFGPQALDWRAFHEAEESKPYYQKLVAFVDAERQSKRIYPPPNVRPFL
jgi:hypothetical protein